MCSGLLDALLSGSLQCKRMCPRKVFCHQHTKTGTGAWKEGPLEEDIPDQCVLIEYLRGAA